MTARMAQGVMAVAVGIWLVATSSAGAQQSAPALDCAKATSNVEMTACASRELKAADVALATVMQRVIAKIDASDHLNANQRKDWKRAMRESQRHWLAWRKKDCGEVMGWEWHGGTGMALAGLNCEIAKVGARKADLEARYLRK